MDAGFVGAREIWNLRGGTLAGRVWVGPNAGLVGSVLVEGVFAPDGDSERCSVVGVDGMTR